MRPSSANIRSERQLVLSDPLVNTTSAGPALVPFCFWLPAAAAQPLTAPPGAAVAGGATPSLRAASGLTDLGRLAALCNSPAGDGLPSPTAPMPAGVAAPSAAAGSAAADPVWPSSPLAHAAAAAAGASAALGLAAPPRPALAGTDPRQLRAAIAAHLAAQGWSTVEPLRWAITAVDRLRGWQLEGVAVAAADATPLPPGPE